MLEKKIIIFITIILFIPLMALAERYKDNGDGTVTDNVTGLMWQKNDDGIIYEWEPAITHCESLSFATYSDWRLPNIKELRSIVDNSRYNPSIDATLFPNSNLKDYWSSTTFAGTQIDAYYVLFSFDGRVNRNIKNYFYYVRCVRGGQ